MAAAEHDLVADDLDTTETEIRHRDRVTSRLAWVARFRAIRERMEADSEPPPRPTPEPPDLPGMRPPADSLH